MSRNAASATTNYTLGEAPAARKAPPSPSIGQALKRLAPLLSDDKRIVALAFGAMVISSTSSLLGPAVIARTVDVHIRGGNWRGVLINSAFLFGIYLCGLSASYYQTLAMGTVGLTVLFKLRNTLFTRLQDLPLAFFTQNK